MKKRQISNVLSAKQVEPLGFGGAGFRYSIESPRKDVPGWRKFCSNPRELAELETVGLSKAKRIAHRQPYVRTEAARTFQGLYLNTLNHLHDMTGEMHKYRATSLTWAMEQVEAWLKKKWIKVRKNRIWGSDEHRDR